MWMPWTSEHTKWLVDTGERLKTADGKDVEVWEFQHQDDDDVLSAWAKLYHRREMISKNKYIIWYIIFLNSCKSLWIKVLGLPASPPVKKRQPVSPE